MATNGKQFAAATGINFPFLWGKAKSTKNPQECWFFVLLAFFVLVRRYPVASRYTINCPPLISIISP